MFHVRQVAVCGRALTMICRAPLDGAIPWGWERDPYIAELHTKALACAFGFSLAEQREMGARARRRAEARYGVGQDDEGASTGRTASHDNRKKATP